jgi:hypothetical protein
MNYKVGDKVLIKTWDQMAIQYSLDDDGDIVDNNGVFTEFTEEVAVDNHRILTIDAINNRGNYFIVAEGAGVFPTFCIDMKVGSIIHTTQLPSITKQQVQTGLAQWADDMGVAPTEPTEPLVCPICGTGKLRDTYYHSTDRTLKTCIACNYRRA